MLGFGIGKLGTLGNIGGGSPSASGPPDIVLPASADGLIGGGLVKPHYVALQGPNAGKYAVGACLTDGTQVVRIFDQDTGALLDTHTVRAVDVAGDDHNLVALCPYPDGSLLACASGHNTTTTLHNSRMDAAGTWTDTTTTFSSTLTYPSLWLDIRGVAWVFIRVGTDNWEYAKRTTISSAWGTPVRYIAEGAQSYSYQRYDSDNDRFLGFIGVLDANPEHGKLKPWALNAATGAFTHNSGASLSIPFASTNVTDLFTPGAGRKLTATQFSRGCNAAVIYDMSDVAGSNDVNVCIWTFPAGSDHTNPTNWTQNAAVFNIDARLAYGTNNNLPGIAFEEALHSGYAFYSTRRINVTDAIVGSGTNAMWSLERWSSSNGSTWASIVLEKRARRGASLGPVTCRPSCAFGADLRTPLMVQRFKSYTDYNAFTGAVVEFVAPWRGRNCFNLEAETTAWLARLTATASNLLIAQVNAIFRDLNDEGLTSRLGFLFIAPTETHEQRKTSLLGGYSATPKDINSNVVAGTFASRGWFGPAGTFYYDLDFVPGVAGNHLMTQDGNCFFVGSCGDGQNNSFVCGTTQLACNPRNTSDQFPNRNASTTSNSPAYIAGRGTHGTRRAAAGSYHRYDGNGATATSVTQTSAALDVTQRFFWGSNNNGSNAVTTIASRDLAYVTGGLHLVNTTDNVKVDSAINTNLNLMFAEAA